MRDLRYRDPRLEKLHRPGVPAVRENDVSWHHGAPETARTSHHFGIEGFNPLIGP